MPKGLGFRLNGHHVRTTQFEGWNELKNGELLRAAADKGYELLITADRGVRFEQHQAALPIPVIVLVSVRNELGDLESLIPDLLRLMGGTLQRRVYEVSNRAG
ncbi:MAG: hypothetical protein ACK4WH_08715 [Phycisphaerales bacterium]